MKLNAKEFLLALTMVLCVCVVDGQVAITSNAQDKVKKEQQPCDTGSKVFVLEPEQVESKLTELNAQGYCVPKRNFLVVGNKLVLMVDKSDLYSDEHEEDPEQ